MATTRQKIAIKKVLKGKPIKHAMIEAGYAPSTAATTSKLTASKGFQKLIDDSLSEKALIKVHKRGLESYNIRFTPEGEQLKVPDFSTQHKYLETGYKLRGKLQNKDERSTNNIFIQNLTIEQRRGLIEEYQRHLAEAGNDGLDSVPKSNESTV